MDKEEIITLIKEIFEDIDDVGKIYKFEIMKSGKIKIKYQDKFYPNIMFEKLLERKANK